MGNSHIVHDESPIFRNGRSCPTGTAPAPKFFRLDGSSFVWKFGAVEIHMNWRSMLQAQMSSVQNPSIILVG